MSASSERAAFAGLVEGRTASSRPVDILPVQPVGRSAVREDLPDARRFQNGRKVVRHSVPDGGVGRAHNIARGDHIPERNVIRQKKRALFLHRLRHVRAEQRRHYPPEAVLRMPVKEHLLAGLYRGKRAEDQNARIRRIDRREGMAQRFHFHFNHLRRGNYP